MEVIRIQRVQLMRKEHSTNQLHRISQTHQSTLLALHLDLEEMEMSIDLAGKCLDHPYSNPDIPIRPMISIKLQLMLLLRHSFRSQSFCKTSERLFVYLTITSNLFVKNLNMDMKIIRIILKQQASILQINHSITPL